MRSDNQNPAQPPGGTLQGMLTIKSHKINRNRLGQTRLTAHRIWLRWTGLRLNGDRTKSKRQAGRLHKFRRAGSTTDGIDAPLRSGQFHPLGIRRLHGVTTPFPSRKAFTRPRKSFQYGQSCCLRTRSAISSRSAGLVFAISLTIDLALSSYHSSPPESRNVPLMHGQAQTIRPQYRCLCQRVSIGCLHSAPTSAATFERSVS